MKLHNEGADAFTSSVYRSSSVSQCVLDFGERPLEEMSCCNAFFRSNDSTGMVNGLEEGFDGKAFAGCFGAVEDEIGRTGEVGLLDSE